MSKCVTNVLQCKLLENCQVVSMDVNANVSEDPSLVELKKWLFDRVADDNDIVVDELQEEFGAYYEKIESESGSVSGSEEYKININLLGTSIAELKEPEGRKKTKCHKEKQKITDGIRPCWYGGMTNADGFPTGEGMLVYDNKDCFKGKFDNGVLNREGVLSLAQNCGLKIQGKWQDSLMEGEMRIEVTESSFLNGKRKLDSSGMFFFFQTEAGGWIEGYYHHGVAHGFQREFGTREFTTAKYPIVRFVGRFYKGVARGFCWRGCLGGGFLCGYVSPKDGTFTGSDIAFIYPDFKHVLRGEFKDGKAVRVQMCQLIGSKCERGMFIPCFTKPQGESYGFEGASRKSLGQNTTTPEPWEAMHVYVRESQLPQGGEGLFAKKSIAKGSVLSFYNGIRLNTASLLMEQRYGHSDYRIRLNAETDLDIPKGWESLDKYSATLSHKANHSFGPNVEWILFEHPRFGLIRGLRALEDLEQDQEILVNYTMNLADSPEWYRILWVKHQRHVKKASDAAIKRILERYTENSSKRVDIPDSEELYVPQPQGIGNIEDMPDDQEIEQHTPKAEILKLRKKEAIIEEEPKVEELD